MDFPNSNLSKLKIVINSCWAFSDMWNNIYFLYKKYWANHPELLIVSDKNENKKLFPNIMCFEGEMTSRLLNALREIDSKYIFLSFDDYYLSKKVNVERLSQLLNEMEIKDVDYCRIFSMPKVRGKKDKNLKYKILPLIRIYEVNFYPSIWKKEALIKVLKENEVIWKAEARITRRSREKSLKCIYINNKNIFDFVDIVRKGKYLRSGYSFIKKNGLYLSSRPKRTIKETVHLNLRSFVANRIPVKLKNLLKKLNKGKNRVYYSDYENTDD